MPMPRSPRAMPTPTARRRRGTKGILRRAAESVGYVASKTTSTVKRAGAAVTNGAVKAGTAVKKGGQAAGAAVGGGVRRLTKSKSVTMMTRTERQQADMEWTTV